MFRVKRIYEAAESSDGYRVLVDRLWPRGVSKEKAKVDLWLKGIAPSDALRKWFGHDPKRWEEFQKRYREELKEESGAVAQLKELQKEHGTVTLLYSAHDEEHNQAVALEKYLKGR
jgi:uncharacterized protein YeaO (DUF488 family)